MNSYLLVDNIYSETTYTEKEYELKEWILLKYGSMNKNSHPIAYFLSSKKCTKKIC